MTKEINIKLDTKKVGEYTIEDMKKMFCKRISKAVFENKTDNCRIYEGLIAKEMSKICKRWKFWNKDIRNAYKNYNGLILAPYTIVCEDVEVFCDNMIITKELKSRYKIRHIDNEKND